MRESYSVQLLKSRVNTSTAEGGYPTSLSPETTTTTNTREATPGNNSRGGPVEHKRRIRVIYGRLLLTNHALLKVLAGSKHGVRIRRTDAGI